MGSLSAIWVNNVGLLGGRVISLMLVTVTDDVVGKFDFLKNRFQ